MKKNLFITAVLLSMAITTIAQVGIGTNDPSESAILELKSTNRGLLFPRMTHTQMRQISNPKEGLVVYCSDCRGGTIMIFDGNIFQFLSKSFYNPNIIIDSYGNEYGTVTGVNSRTWLDRNLGASRIATSADDHEAYGSLFQFGRYSDGHELVAWEDSTTGVMTETESSQLDTHYYPAYDKFITTTETNHWTTSGQTLWGGQQGTNNPCPSGFRVPTTTEWNQEKNSWTSDGINSVLKLPKAGMRTYNNGSYVNSSSDYLYWTSTSESGYLAMMFKNTLFISTHKANGYPVRCINEN